MNETEEKQLRELIWEANPSNGKLQDDIINLVNEIVHNHETKERLEIMENKLD